MENKITLENLRKYLLLKKWEIMPFNSKLDIITFNKDGEEIRIVIPNSEGLNDYKPRVNGLIKSLSSIEQRNAEEVENDITNIGYNLLKIRFDSPETKYGTILLNHAINSIETVKDIIKYEACSVIEPRSDYRKAFQEAKILADNCELAQTEFGSFIIKIRIPSDELFIKKIKNQEGYVKDLGMKTISRLIEGVTESKDVNLEDEEEFKKGYNRKLNKKVCEKISDLMISDDGFNLEISAKWDPSKEIEDEMPSFVRLEPKELFKKFNRMSVYLEKIPEEEIATIQGKILTIKLEESNKGEQFDKDLVKIFSKEKKRNIFVILGKREHNIACDAYKAKKLIEISGILKQKDSGSWYLEDPKDVKIVDKLKSN